jgi:hypothetical protein
MNDVYDAGDYLIHYRSSYEGDREVVEEILHYVQEGQPISKEELEKDFIVMDERDLQHELDEQSPMSRENFYAALGEARYKEGPP